MTGLFKDDCQEINFDEPTTKRGRTRKGTHGRARPAEGGFKITQEELKKMPGHVKPVGPKGD